MKKCLTIKQKSRALQLGSLHDSDQPIMVSSDDMISTHGVGEWVVRWYVPGIVGRIQIL